jgi:hypothetical protein
MFASGCGEFLANPPVAIKNYQIATVSWSARKSISNMYAVHGYGAFFRGVLPGEGKDETS